MMCKQLTKGLWYRRTNSRLTLFYKAVHDQAGISLHHLQKPLRNTRSPDDTTFIALSARKNPYLFSFSLGPLLIGTKCHANSAWNHQSTLSVSLCTVHQLFNRHSQPWHSSGNGLMPIAGYLPKNRRTQLQTRQDSFVLSRPSFDEFCLVSTQFPISKFSVILSIFETEQLQIGNWVETRQDSFVLSVSAVWTSYYRYASTHMLSANERQFQYTHIYPMSLSSADT